jgi:hypothetical protein
MKMFAVLAAVVMTGFSSPAQQPTWQELTSRLFTNAPIVWRATNTLPKSFWIYQRTLPRVFTAPVISNAIVLASLQKKGFPKPSTNEFSIVEDKGPHYPGPIPVIFAIRPADASMDYGSPHEVIVPGKTIISDESVIAQAGKAAMQLGLDPEKLATGKVYTRKCDTDQSGNAASHTCGRGVFLSRQLDGVTFFSYDNDTAAAEGLAIEFGIYGGIKSFSLRWSDMARLKNQATASPQEIIQCILTHKAIILPMGNEDYFAKLKTLATAKKLTVTCITPYYSESFFGETPTNDAPCQFAMPFAELEAIADLGNNKLTFQMVAPITLADVIRVLKK